MKKSDLLKQQRAALEAEIKPLLEVADLSPDQSRSFDEINGKIEALNLEITREEKRELMIAASAGASGATLSAKEENEIGNYSFARAIRLLAEGKSVDGLEGEMDKEGRREFASVGKDVKGFTVPMIVLNQRASTGQNITTAGDGGNLLREDPFIFIEALKNALVMVEMGATFLPGLVGTLPLLRGGSFTASWVAEGSAVSFTKEAFTKATMTPKNLMVAGAISKQTLVQTNNIADKLIRDELISAISHGIQLAAINGAGAPAPTGILGTAGIGAVVGGDNGLAAAWSHIVDLESKVLAANAPKGNIAYLTNSKVNGKLKQTLQAAGVPGFIVNGGYTNGSKMFVSNAVPSNLTKGTSEGVCSAIIAGVWSELFIGMWGGLDLVVDPYTRADYNEIKLVLNQFADVACRNAASFAAMKDVLTA